MSNHGTSIMSQIKNKMVELIVLLHYARSYVELVKRLFSEKFPMERKSYVTIKTLAFYELLISNSRVIF